MFEREIWDCRFDYVPDMRSDVEIEAEAESKESGVRSKELEIKPEKKMTIKMPCDFKLKNLDKYPRCCQHCYFDRVQAHLRTIPLASITRAHGARLTTKHTKDTKKSEA